MCFSSVILYLNFTTCFWQSVCDLHWCQGYLSCVVEPHREERCRTAGCRTVLPKCCRGGTICGGMINFIASLCHIKRNLSFCSDVSKRLNKTLLGWILYFFVSFKQRSYLFQRCLLGAGQVSKSQKGLYDTCNPVIRPSLSQRRDFAQIWKSHCGLDCRQLPMMSTLFILCL